MDLRTLHDAERYLDGLINLERRTGFDYERLGLGRIRALLAAIGSPEKGLPCVHVAGSNGKGSVALVAEALLRASGRRVGTYTSPHLASWRERFRVDGRAIEAEDLLPVLRAMQPAIERQRRDPELCPSFFDVSTALALAVFRDSGVDSGVIEVGIGGRLDSTNVVESVVAVITAVQLEHTDKLGDTLALIAAEKAGIVRHRVPVVHGPLAPEALDALVARCAGRAAPLEEVKAHEIELGPDGVRFRLEDGREVRSPVLGAHQATNLAIGIRAAEHFLGRRLDPSALRALGELRLPARLERIGRVILDSAHTRDAAVALRETLETVEPGRRWVLATSISRDKDAAAILEVLAPRVRACVVTHAEPTRSQDPEALRSVARRAGIETVESVPEPVAAVERALALAGAQDLVVAAGSVYFAGSIRDHLLARPGAR